MAPRTIVIVLVILVCGGGLLAWRAVDAQTGASATAPDPPAIPVTAGTAAQQDVPEYVEGLGTVQPIDTVAVQSRVAGQIMQVLFTPGQDVKEGAPLFLIDPRPFQAALDQANAQLAHDQAVVAEAQLDLTRFQSLVASKAIPNQQAQDQAFLVQQDLGTVDLDKANVETAQLNLDYCHINAPIAGRTGALQVDLGNILQTTTATTLVTLTQIKPIYVSFTIPQKWSDRVRQNQAKGALEVSAFTQSGKLVGPGTLTVIDNTVNTSTGTIMLQATFPNQDETLWPNEFVTARLTLGTRQNAITVPNEAVMEGPNGTYVYVIDSDDTVHRVDVDVEVRQDGIAVISKGLTSGERVVVNGQYRLTDNVKVSIQPASSAG